MKIRQMTKYIIGDTMRSLVILYIVVLVVLSGIGLFVALVPGSVGGVNGLGFMPVIVLFVFGIICFYVYLKTGFSVSVSRRTVFLSILIAGAILIPLNGVLVLVLSWLSALLFGGPNEAWDVIFFGWTTDMQATSLAYSLGGSQIEPAFQFPEFAQGASPAALIVATIIYYTVATFTGFAAGCFVGGLYYRMNTPTKVAVSVGGGLLLFIVLPSALVSEPGSWAYGMVAWLIAIGDFCVLSPYNTTLVSAACALVFIFLFWLLIRRAPVKE